MLSRNWNSLKHLKRLGEVVNDEWMQKNVSASSKIKPNLRLKKDELTLVTARFMSIVLHAGSGLPGVEIEEADEDSVSESK